MPHARGPHPRTRAPHLLQLVKGRGPVVYTRARSGGAPADLPPEVTWMHTADFHCPRHAGCRLLIFSPLPPGQPPSRLPSPRCGLRPASRSSVARWTGPAQAGICPSATRPDLSAPSRGSLARSLVARTPLHRSGAAGATVNKAARKIRVQPSV